MDRLGVFDPVKMGGSVYLYSGKASAGILSSLLGPSSDGRALSESFVLDISPSGLVRAYEQQGKWKLRFLQFELSELGILLYVFRPPKLSLKDRIHNKSLSPPRSRSSGNPSSTPPPTNSERFSQHISTGKAICKSRVVLSSSPVTVRKLRLTEGSSSVGMFALRRCDGLDDTEDKVKVATVVQVLLEGNRFVEFFGRDEEHAEKWISRLNSVALVHRAFHALQKTCTTPSGYPASLRTRDEFVVSVPGTKYARISGELHVQHTASGFSVCIVSEPSRGAEMIFWRVCFDETPILEPQSISFPVVKLTALEQDRVNLGDSDFLVGRQSQWLTLESISQATLGKLFYYTRWASFLGSFVKYFEELNEDDQSSSTTSANRFRSSSRLLRDTSSFTASPRVLAAADRGKLNESFSDNDDNEDASVAASSVAAKESSPPPSDPASGAASTTAPPPPPPPPPAAITGPSLEVQVSIALEGQRSFQRTLSPSRGAARPSSETTTAAGDPTLAKHSNLELSTSSGGVPAPAAAAANAGRSEDAAHHARSIIPPESSSSSALPTFSSHGGLGGPNVTQKYLERRAADERLCRQVPLLLQRGEAEAVMRHMMDFFEQHGDFHQPD